MEFERTGRSAEELIEAFVASETRFPAFVELTEMGAEALPAIRDGLEHSDWQVRKWSAMFLDHHADEASLQALLPLLDDPKSDVRLWAVHSLSCDGCKPGCNPIDVVPLLLDRIELDESIRVRRMATAMLAEREPDERAVPLLESVAATAEDSKLRRHAERVLDLYATAAADT